MRTNDESLRELARILHDVSACIECPTDEEMDLMVDLYQLQAGREPCLVCQAIYEKLVKHAVTCVVAGEKEGSTHENDRRA